MHRVKMLRLGIHITAKIGGLTCLWFMLFDMTAAKGDSIPLTENQIVTIRNAPQGLIPLESECHVSIDPERIRAFFLPKTEVHRLAFDRSFSFLGDYAIYGYAAKGKLTLPKDLPVQISSQVSKNAAFAEAGWPGKGFVGAFIHVEGALVTNANQILFWRLYSDKVLDLWDENKEEWLLIKN